jgi:hypothetical protein
MKGAINMYLKIIVGYYPLFKWKGVIIRSRIIRRFQKFWLTNKIELFGSGDRFWGQMSGDKYIYPILNYKFSQLYNQ